MQIVLEISRFIYFLGDWRKRFLKLPKWYSLTDQLRRSSRSVGAQLAEAWGKRKYKKHFVNKLTDADGEQLETQHWIETAMDCSYFSFKLGSGLLSQYNSIGRMLNSMMNKSHLFCKA